MSVCYITVRCSDPVLIIQGKRVRFMKHISTRKCYFKNLRHLFLKSTKPLIRSLINYTILFCTGAIGAADCDSARQKNFPFVLSKVLVMMCSKKPRTRHDCEPDESIQNSPVPLL